MNSNWLQWTRLIKKGWKGCPGCFDWAVRIEIVVFPLFSSSISLRLPIRTRLTILSCSVDKHDSGQIPVRAVLFKKNRQHLPRPLRFRSYFKEPGRGVLFSFARLRGLSSQSGVFFSPSTSSWFFLFLTGFSLKLLLHLSSFLILVFIPNTFSLFFLFLFGLQCVFWGEPRIPIYDDSVGSSSPSPPLSSPPPPYPMGPQHLLHTAVYYKDQSRWRCAFSLPAAEIAHPISAISANSFTVAESA